MSLPKFNSVTAGSLSNKTLNRIRKYRYQRLLDIMQKRDVPALLLYDPVNIRYACDARNMQVFCLNHDSRYLFVSASGYMVMFDWFKGDVYFGDLIHLDEVRIGQTYGFVANDDVLFEKTLSIWATELADLMHQHSPDNLRIGIDRLSPFAAYALEEQGINVIDGQGAVYEARSIKSSDEITAMKIAMAACDDGFKRMREQLKSGMTEVELWALLHQANIEWEGEWINARLLASGPRTNPWSQEASLRVIEPGDIVGCDSDLIGPYGYAADISRTWVADGKPTDRHRKLYSLSYEHVQANIEMCKPGVTFFELMERNYKLPKGLREQMFTSYAHGIGLENEWPIIKYADKADLHGGYGGGYDGVLQAGMTLCIESYVGEVGGPDGIKLEEQILITDSGPVSLSQSTFEEDWF